MVVNELSKQEKFQVSKYVVLYMFSIDQIKYNCNEYILPNIYKKIKQIHWLIDLTNSSPKTLKTIEKNQ